MRSGFVHIADVHLGTEQYGSRERADDFGRQWRRFASWAVENRDKVSAALIAGDLFNRYNVDPETFGQAREGLRILKQAGIPVFDVEGNHDRHRRRGAKTWLEVLAEEGLFYLLDATSFERVGGDDGTSELRCHLSPLDRNEGWGSYVDLDGMRIVGMRYMGASTPQAVDALVRALDDLPKGNVEYTALLLHGGVQGVIPQMNAELSDPDLAKLKGRVDYLALGHIHKNYEQDSWIFNPGSTETWRADEAAWPHGFYHVTVDTRSSGKHLARLIEPQRRLFLTIAVDVSESASPADVYRLADRRIQEARQKHPRVRPVVHLLLHGTSRFDRRDLDSGILLARVDEVFTPIARKLTDHSHLPEFALTAGGEAEPGFNRHELARQVLAEINRGDERYQRHAEPIAALGLEAMLRAADEPPDEIGRLILERWRALKERPAPDEQTAGAGSPVPALVAEA